MPRQIALVIMALAAALVVFHPARAQNQLRITLSPGFDGYFRADRWLPVLVSVSNNGSDISGDLRVSTSDGNAYLTGTFGTHVDLPNGSSKQIFLYTNVTYSAQLIKVELVTSSGIVADASEPIKAIQASDLLFAVITESPRGIVDLQGVHSGMGASHQINWAIASIPDNSAALRALDVMLFTDVDSGNLTLTQRQAMGDWVRLGGHLVVTGGPNWQKTQAGVADLLPFTPTASTTLASLPSLAVYAGHPTDKLEGPASSAIVVAQGAPTTGATTLVQESGTPLLMRRQLGNGTVDYLAVDPGLEPYQSWKNRNGFWLTLFTTTQQQPTWTAGIANVNSAQTAANLIKGLRLPDVVQLMQFLAIYIIVIGPLNYLVLRRLKRPELAWFTIPLIVAACSTTAYFTGFSLRGTQATVNRLALVQVSPDSDRAAVDSVIGVLAPRRASYNVAVGDGMTLRPLVDGADALGSSGSLISQYPNYQAINVPVDAGLTAVFASSGFTKAPTLQGLATIALPKAQPTKTGSQPTPTFRTNPTSTAPPEVSGTVKNTTGLTLDNAVVLAMGGSQEIGTLKPGDSVNFDFTMSPTNGLSAPISQSNTLLQRLPLGTFSFSAASNLTSVPTMTVQDIMGHNYISYYGVGYRTYTLGYGDNPEQQELRRREAFLQTVATDQEPSGGRGVNVYVAGWTTESPVSVELTGAAYQTEDTTLYIFRLPVAIQPTTEPIQLPYSFLTWQATDESTQRQLTPYGLSVQVGEKAVFRYTPLPLIRFQDVTKLQVMLSASFYNQGVISLWDWTQDQWVNIGANTQQTTIDSDPQRFVGPEDAVQLMVETAPQYHQVNYDRIDIALQGHLASVAR